MNEALLSTFVSYDRTPSLGHRFGTWRSPLRCWPCTGLYDRVHVQYSAVQATSQPTAAVQIPPPAGKLQRPGPEPWSA
jgi:hypothetical protein